MSTYWHKVLGFYRDFLPQDSKTEIEGVWSGIEETVKDRTSRMSLAESALKLDGGNGYRSVPNDILDMSSFNYSVDPTMELDENLFQFDELVSAINTETPTTFTRGVDFSISNGVLTWSADPGSYDYLFISSAAYKSQVWIDFYRNWFGFEGDPYDYYAPEYIPHLIRSLANLMQYGPVQKYQRWALTAMAGIPVSPVSGTVSAKADYTSVDGSTIRKITITDSSGVTHDVFTAMASADLLATDTTVEIWQPLSIKTTGWDHVELRPYIDKIRSENHLYPLDDAGTTDLTEEAVDVWTSDDPTALTKNGGTLEIDSDGSVIYLRNKDSIVLGYGYYEWLIKFAADEVPDFTMRVYDFTTDQELYDDRKICSRFMNHELFGQGRFYDQYIRFDMDSSSWEASTSLITKDYTNGLLGLYFSTQDGYVENIIGGLPFNTSKALYFSGYLTGSFKISILDLDDVVIDTATVTGTGEYLMKRISFTTPSDSHYVKVRVERTMGALATIPNSDFSTWTDAYNPANWTISVAPLGMISKEASAIRFDGKGRADIYATLTSPMVAGQVYRIDADQSRAIGGRFRYFLSKTSGGAKQEIMSGVGFTADEAHTHIHVRYSGRKNRSNAVLSQLSLYTTTRDIESIELDMAMVGDPSDIARKRFFVDENGMSFRGRITFDGFDGDAGAQFVLEEWKIYELKRLPYLVPVSSISSDEVYISDEPGIAAALEVSGGHESIQVDHDTALEDLSGVALTLESKFQISALQAGRIASLDEGGASIVAVGIDADGKPVGTVDGVTSGATSITGPNAVSLNESHHIALRHTGTNLELRLDHETVATLPFTEAVSSSLTAQLRIGTDGSGSDFVGHIEWVRAWSDTRTDYELMNNRNRRVGADALTSLDTDNLIEVWEFADLIPASDNRGITDGASFDAGAAAGLLDTETAVTITAWISPKELRNGVIIGRGDNTAAGTTMMFEISRERLAAVLSDGTDIATYRVPSVNRMTAEEMIPIQLIWSAAGLLNVGDIENNVRIYQNGRLVGLASDEELGLTMSALPGAPVGSTISIAADTDGERALSGMHENYAIYQAVKDADLANTGSSVFVDPDLNSSPSSLFWQISRKLRIETESGADNSYKITQKYKSSEHTDLKDGRVTVLMPAVIGEVYKIDMKMNFVDGGSGNVAGPGTVTLKLKGTTIDDALDTAGGFEVKSNNTTLYDNSILVQADSTVVKLIFETSTRYGWELHFYKIDGHSVASASIDLIKSEGPDADLEDVAVTPTLGTPDVYWPMQNDLNDSIGANNLSTVGSGSARVGKAVPGRHGSGGMDGTVV